MSRRKDRQTDGSRSSRGTEAETSGLETLSISKPPHKAPLTSKHLEDRAAKYNAQPLFGFPREGQGQNAKPNPDAETAGNRAG